MGYAHGRKWTDQSIRDGISNVVQGLGLSRMPSRAECEAYCGNYSLTNAVSKRIGWYRLANEMGLSIKDSDTYFGKTHEAIANDKLLSLGYKTQRMPQNFPYDILVNGRVKIDVKVSRLYHGTQGDFYSFNLEKRHSTCDIYWLHLANDKGNVAKTLIIPSVVVSENTQISVGAYVSRYDKYENRLDYIDQYDAFLATVG